MTIKHPRRLLHSHRRTCPYKVKLELENAQEYLLAAQTDTSRYQNGKGEDLILYLCQACGYLHIGHDIFKKDTS